jgi:hypothetical protein
MMLVKDLAADPETESGTLIAFGGEKGFEEMTKRLVIDAVASIADGDADAGTSGAPIGLVAGADPQDTAALGRVERISDEVCEDLTEF